MKSREEILKDNGIYLGFSSSYTGEGILSAMEQYASQQAPAMYTREQVELAIEFGCRQHIKNDYIDSEEAEQFIQSLK